MQCSHLPPHGLRAKTERILCARTFHTQPRVVLTLPWGLFPIVQRSMGRSRSRSRPHQVQLQGGQGCRLQGSSRQTPLLCKLVWGQGTRSEVTAGSGRARGWGSSRQEDGDGNPLLEFLPGVRLGVTVECLPGPAGPSRYTQGAEHRVRDEFKFQSAPKGLGFHVTLISSFVNTDYRDDLLSLEEWEIMSFQMPQGLAHSGVQPVFAE